MGESLEVLTSTASSYSLLKIPPEVRLHIFSYVLQSYHVKNVPYSASTCRTTPVYTCDLSLLLTCRQIYREARHLPLVSHEFSTHMYDCDHSITSLLEKAGKRWQLAQMRQLCLKIFDCSSDSYFVRMGRKEYEEVVAEQQQQQEQEQGKKGSNGSPASSIVLPRSIPTDHLLPLQNLDILTLETTAYVTYRARPYWYGHWEGTRDYSKDEDTDIVSRQVSSFLKIVYGARMRFKQLNLILHEYDIADNYKHHYVILFDRLLELFRKSVRAIGQGHDLLGEERDDTGPFQPRWPPPTDPPEVGIDDTVDPEWTIYHSINLKEQWAGDDRFTLFHTPTLHLHQSPQWVPSALPDLRSGRKCIRPPPPPHPRARNASEASTNDNDNEEKVESSNATSASGRRRRPRKLDWPILHVREVKGLPGAQRKDVCEACKDVDADDGDEGDTVGKDGGEVAG